MQNEIQNNDEEFDVKETTMFANNNQVKTSTIAKNLCPECGEPLVYEGGCVSCKNCGYSKCN